MFGSRRRFGLGLRLNYWPHATAAGVIFSGQNFCRAQSQNCETKKHTPVPRAKPVATPAQK
jgi:hypothetical protein